ncbi:alpha/beta hydrolase [Nitratifractor sp.]
MKRLVLGFFLVPLLLTAGSRELSIQSSDGFVLKGWLTLPEKGKKPYPLALLIHEFAADHTMWDPLASNLRQKGYATFAPDLRAHGASTDKKGKKVTVTLKDFGKPLPEAALEKIPEDLKRWMEVLENDKALNLEAPLFFGSSLGGGSLVPLMLDYEPKLVVTLSPASPKKPYADDAWEAVENVDTAWLLISSRNDFALKASLAYDRKALRPTLLVLPGSGHGSKLLPAAREYIDLFIRRYTP